MKVLILGMDGYIGWPLALHLAESGMEVAGIDNQSRRNNVEEVGSRSAIPISSNKKRMSLVQEIYGDQVSFTGGDLLDYNFVSNILKTSKPDAIVHLAEQPSAPYSMIDAQHAVYTQHNNVIGTLNLLFAVRDICPDAHILKLGTMGEYGTPSTDIPEGLFEVEYNGRKANMMFPKQPGSFYHASKVHDTHNIVLACKLWGLRSTDIMQGVVYGTRTGEVNATETPGLSTRFDFDEVFGTVINRYCAQAIIGHDLSVYGKGGQTRGFIALIDSIQCLTLACKNPPTRGEYRVFNQLEGTYRVSDLADLVQGVARELGLNVKIRHKENPRQELEEHYYNVEARRLRDLGFKPTRSMYEEVKMMLDDLMLFKERIKKTESAMEQDITWKKGRMKTIEQSATLT